VRTILGGYSCGLSPPSYGPYPPSCGPAFVGSWCGKSRFLAVIRLPLILCCRHFPQNSLFHFDNFRKFESVDDGGFGGSAATFSDCLPQQGKSPPFRSGSFLFWAPDYALFALFCGFFCFAIVVVTVCFVAVFLQPALTNLLFLPPLHLLLVVGCCVPPSCTFFLGLRAPHKTFSIPRPQCST
jgi:hypothetical protein